MPMKKENVKCFCQHNRNCPVGVSRKLTVGVYNADIEEVQRLGFLVGNCYSASIVCDIQQALLKSTIPEDHCVLYNDII